MSRGRRKSGTNPKVLSHYNITSNTISIFRMVDDKRQDLKLTDGKEIDATKMSRFIRINELRLVTEYNPVVTKDPHIQSPAFTSRTKYCPLTDFFAPDT
uniref:Endoplasmic reticulum protein 27 n=1 Tax=Chelydra serpentina TaxID=8475 RepID=A0A8C3STB3_CHESE